MRIVLRTALSSLAILLAISAPTNALEIYGNQTLGDSGRQFLTDYLWMAQGFNTGSTAYDLTAVRIGLRFSQDLPSGISIAIYEGSITNGTSPNFWYSPDLNNQVGTFDTSTPTPSFAEGNQLYSFALNGSLQLQANTNYWVVVDASAATEVFDWSYAAANPPLTEELNAPVGLNGSGVTYLGTAADNFSTVVDFSTTYSGLSFNVVPEPSTYALGIAGTLVMGTIARRKNRKTASA